MLDNGLPYGAPPDWPESERNRLHRAEALLRKCQSQFQKYAIHHVNKGTAESNEKAIVNLGLVKQIDDHFKGIG